MKTARGRKSSSTRWLRRQLNDPYVRAAKAEGYRSRAAYKLIQLDDRFRLLRPGAVVVDLGAAPGGWSQVALRRAPGGRIVAVDLAPFEDLAGIERLCLDLREPEAIARIAAALGRPADLVLSDMAPAASGHRASDQARIADLVAAAAALAIALLRPGGGFIAKAWQGGIEADLLADLKRRFGSVRHAKPAASRDDSAETYLVARDFRDPAGS